MLSNSPTPKLGLGLYEPRGAPTFAAPGSARLGDVRRIASGRGRGPWWADFVRTYEERTGAITTETFGNSARRCSEIGSSQRRFRVT